MKYLTNSGLSYFFNKIKAYLTSSTYLNSIGISNSEIDDIADDAGYSSGSLPDSEDIFITGDIIPNTDNSVDLGASSKNIKMIYTKGITINGTQFLPSDYIPKAGSNQISGDLVPSTDGTVNLGGTSYQWNNLYAKNYYYKGVAWGLDQANVWNTYQTIKGSNFGNEQSPNGRTCLYLTSNRDTVGQSGIYITKFRQNRAQGAMNPVDLQFIAIDVLENSIRTNCALQLNITNWNGDVPSGAVLFSNLSDAQLGSSLAPWKTLNGINPGALSLPGASVNVDTTNWVLDGTPNHFVPTSDGWFGIQCTDTIYDQTHYVFVGRIGGGSSYYQQNLALPVNALWDNLYHGSIFIPVIKNMNYDIRCICNNIVAKFYPCQGNV